MMRSFNKQRFMNWVFRGMAIPITRTISQPSSAIDVDIHCKSKLNASWRRSIAAFGVIETRCWSDSRGPEVEISDRHPMHERDANIYTSLTLVSTHAIYSARTVMQKTSSDSSLSMNASRLQPDRASDLLQQAPASARARVETIFLWYS